MTIHQYLSKAVQDDAQRAGERYRLLLEARRARAARRPRAGPAAPVKRMAWLLLRRATPKTADRVLADREAAAAGQISARAAPVAARAAGGRPAPGVPRVALENKARDAGTGCAGTDQVPLWAATDRGVRFVTAAHNGLPGGPADTSGRGHGDGGDCRERNRLRGS